MSKKNIHDSLFKKTLSFVRDVRALFDNFIPNHITDTLDLDSLQNENVSYVDEQLEEYFADIIYSCRTKDGEQVEISFLLEHKSYYDKGLPLQLLRYLNQGYTTLYQEDKKKKLKFILPILIYHGEQKWRDTKFPDMVNVPNIELNPYVPTFNYEVIDLANITDEVIMSVKSGLMLRSTLLLFKHKNDKAYVLNNSVELFTFVEYELDEEEKKSVIRSLLHYIFRIHTLQKDEFKSFTKKLDDMSQAVAGSLWDTLISEGRVEGRVEGRMEGIIQGSAKEEMLRAILVLLSVFRKLPDYSDFEVADLVRTTIARTQKLRKLLDKHQSKTAEKAITDTFFRKMNISEKERKELMSAIDKYYSTKKK